MKDWNYYPAILNRTEVGQNEHEQEQRNKISTVQYPTEEEDELSNQFEMKFLNRQKQQVLQIKGSTRFILIALELFFGFICLYILNSLMKNNCYQDYSHYGCIESNHPKCQKLLSCFRQHPHSYFSIEENIILIMGWTIFVLIYNQMQRPLRIAWQKGSSSKRV